MKKENKSHFKPGNQIWRLRNPDFSGRPPKYKTPNELWAECVQYFDYCDNNPIISEEKTSMPKGTFEKEVKHKVPYTWQGLYVFLGVKDLEHYKTKSDFSEILTYLGNIIFDQKFSGAAAGIFNSAIIAKDLGLVDKKETTHFGDFEIGGTKKINLDED